MKYGGFNLNWINVDNDSILYIAARRGLTTTVKALLEQGADPNVGEGKALIKVVD